MLVEELPEAWRHAQVLLCAQHEKEPDKEASSREFLQPRLQLLPGVPTAVGSGRASVPHKIRAVAHSQRLEVNSWGQVAVLMNSTFSLTGDLGTESRVCGWAGDLDMLMGKWISSEDGAEEEEPGFSFVSTLRPSPRICRCDTTLSFRLPEANLRVGAFVQFP